MAQTYTVNFSNQSNSSGTACLYQALSNIASLAWLSSSGMNFPLRWTDDYGFTWAQTGVLSPGVIYNPNKYSGVNLQSTNQETHTVSDGMMRFIDQGAGPQPGTLYIQQDGTIPANQVSVGIGMSGRPVLAVQARPNTMITFPTPPRYWITFGSFQQGQVLPIDSLTNRAQIVFPAGVFSMTATFNANGIWTVQPSVQMRK